MLDPTKPIYARPDGTYVVTFNDLPYHVIPGDPVMDEVEAFLAEHPGYAQPEPGPPEPTPEEIAERERAAKLARLAELDKRSIRPLRAIDAGTATQDDRDVLAAIEVEVAAIRATL